MKLKRILATAALFLALSSGAFAVERLVHDGSGSRNSTINSPHSTVGVQVTGTMQAFGGASIAAAQPALVSRGVLLQGELQPLAWRSFGVLSAGLTLGLFPTEYSAATSAQAATNSVFSIFSVGAQARYQFRYSPDQLFVPSVSMDGQLLRYSLNVGGAGILPMAGYQAGLALLLNRLAPDEARSFFHGEGISKTYLVTHVTSMNGRDENIQVSGHSLYLGVRFEY